MSNPNAAGTPSAYPLRLTRVALAYLRRKAVLPTGPLRLWVEPTNVCNLRCPMCLTPHLGNEVPKGLMSVATFGTIIDKARGHVRDVNLFLGGEPLINKQLPTMIRIAKEAGMYTRLHTNATLLDEKWAHELLDAHLDFLSFSFDGADEETYTKYRVGGNFQATCENIQRFARIKRERGAQHPHTVVQLIERPEWTPMERDAQRAGIKRLFGDPGIERLKFIQLHNFGGLLEDPEFLEGRSFSPCSFLWYALNVSFDGTVVPCCLDFARKYPIGNLLEQDLMDVWNGPLLVALRQKMIDKDIEDVALCNGCDVPYKKKVMGIPVRNAQAVREFLESALEPIRKGD